MEAPKSPIAIAVAVAVALAGVAPIFQKAQKATSAPVNMVIIDLPPNPAAAGAAHCVGDEVVVIVVATPVRVPDVIRAGVVPRVHCAIVSVDALSGAAVVRFVPRRFEGGYGSFEGPKSGANVAICLSRNQAEYEKVAKFNINCTRVLGQFENFLDHARLANRNIILSSEKFDD